MTLSSNQTAVKAGETALITFSFSEDPGTSFTLTTDDVTVSGGTLSGFGGSGVNYTATFTPAANSTSAASIGVGTSVFSDAAGNLNTAGGTVGLTVDTVVPTVVVSSNRTAVNAGETALISFTLSESAVDFVSSDVTVLSLIHI